MPIVIFDRSFSLTEKEFNWCKKFNTHLFEPALYSGRTGFGYLPEWTSDYDIFIDGPDKEYDLIYSDNQLEYKLKGFEKWIKNFARFFPNKKVAYSCNEKLTSFLKEEFEKNYIMRVIGKENIYDSGKFTVVIDTDMAYKIGYFNSNYFSAMNNGCLPLLPYEHKYFHGMFKGLVINDLKEMDYFISSYWRIREVLIEEIFDRIKNKWPEFTVNHAVDVIGNCYE
jgi:hypothetical protein